MMAAMPGMMPGMMMPGIDMSAMMSMAGMGTFGEFELFGLLQ